MDSIDRVLRLEYGMRESTWGRESNLWVIFSIYGFG
jgi:hypothetical protein